MSKFDVLIQRVIGRLVRVNYAPATFVRGTITAAEYVDRRLSSTGDRFICQFKITVEVRVKEGLSYRTFVVEDLPRSNASVREIQENIATLRKFGMVKEAEMQEKVLGAYTEIKVVAFDD